MIRIFSAFKNTNIFELKNLVLQVILLSNKNHKSKVKKSIHNFNSFYTIYRKILQIFLSVFFGFYLSVSVDFSALI